MHALVGFAHRSQQSCDVGRVLSSDFSLNKAGVFSLPHSSRRLVVSALSLIQPSPLSLLANISISLWQHPSTPHNRSCARTPPLAASSVPRPSRGAPEVWCFQRSMFGSHSMRPPKGICCTTTRFPSTSALITISYSCRNECAVLLPGTS